MVSIWCIYGVYIVYMVYVWCMYGVYIIISMVTMSALCSLGCFSLKRVSKNRRKLSLSLI